MQAAMQASVQNKLKEVLDALSPREAKVYMRFGLEMAKRPHFGRSWQSV